MNLVERDGEPAFWSLRRLLRAPPPTPPAGTPVFVCENPNLVAIAADALGPRSAPLVCTDGMPAAAQRALLARLLAAGARLRYHGDFDWPGIAIASLVLREFGALPWRMDAADYAAGLAMQPPGVAAPLDGTPVAPAWSPALGAAMHDRGCALPEEAVAAGLLDDLESAGPAA
ncbi:MAG: TIGR02679 family protein [Comamonadaceae bacterium]|nr:TIGR02679 family protein [Comamonadaceae bacterium]